MKRISMWVATTFSLLFPLVSQAHPGHGDFPADDIRHYWESPEHFVPITIMALVLAAILVQIVQLVTKAKKEEEVNDK